MYVVNILSSSSLLMCLHLKMVLGVLYVPRTILSRHFISSSASRREPTKMHYQGLPYHLSKLTIWIMLILFIKS